MSIMEKVMQGDAAKNWVSILVGDESEPLYFCKGTGCLHNKDGSLSSKQIKQRYFEESSSDDSDDSGDSEDAVEGSFGYYLHQFISSLKPKPRRWTELATSYASKQLPGSWESDTEEDTELEGSQQIPNPKQTADIVLSSLSDGPSL